jgi:hypothetical protein
VQRMNTLLLLAALTLFGWYLTKAILGIAERE